MASRRSFDFSEERTLTNAELAEELSMFTTLTADQIESLMPRKIDKERFSELIDIVGSAASHNSKVASLRANFTELGGVLVKVLGTIV